MATQDGPQVPRDLGGTPTEREGATVDSPMGRGLLAEGVQLGGRYLIRSRIGAGGMGEVWRAFDLKLRVEVALKALRQDMFEDERHRDVLRREVRAAREVVSPNVCRIYDLIEADGHELVSMEYVDGQTLLAVLQERGPLELAEAQDVASQFLAGLEAIHRAGLVHRDVKPENIMLTRAGRVVVMDFGLARHETDPAQSASGTPAYMAPEQARGEAVDARADVYAAGVVLAEMVVPEGIKNIQSRQSLWEGVRSEPPRLPNTPWAPVLKKAVASEPDRRFKTAHTLTRALEDVTLRVVGAEDLHPYPGLAFFTEADAEHFFGREAEVEQMWAKLEGPARLLGLVGPSGAGKSSFLRAGLVPSARPGWATVVCTPGGDPRASLRRAVVSGLAGDAEAMRELAAGSDDSTVSAIGRWRGRHEHALVIVDQFEELYTQNGADEQQSFAELLGRLVLDADVVVLLAMRDDFLIHCNRQEPLRPLFSELTPLDPPTGAALRRALTQPALQCGYRFEDDALIEEMLGEVEGERGALPLLAFAAARLWEKRDRDNGLLTRRAFHDIGGVGGALARHAEATMDRIGSERIGIVRELFRNLVTAEGTRAVREWGELLSVFDSEPNPLSSRARRPKAETQPLSSRASAGPKGRSESRDPHREQTTSPPTGSPQATGDPSTRSLRSLAQDDIGTAARESAEEVLRALVDARLLTTYEVTEEDREPTRRVEIIHESLLANWPRLVRWQTQDADAAQLRDQLRQAAKTWHEHGRSDDLLWSGSAFREYAVWRERYPGGLSAVEQAFGDAMVALAGRRRRRRRVAYAVLLAAVVLVAGVLGVLLQRSVRATRRAEAELAEREAAQLLALGRLELTDSPNRALAYAIASIERTDNDPARRFAVEALWQGPPALFLSDEALHPLTLLWSADGRQLALNGHGGLVLVDGATGQQRQLSSASQGVWAFTSDGRRLVTHAGSPPRTLNVWALPEGGLERTITYADGETAQPAGDRVQTLSGQADGSVLFRSLAIDGSAPVVRGRWTPPRDLAAWTIDSTGTWLVTVEGGRIIQRPLDDLAAPGRLIGTHEGAFDVFAWTLRDRAVTFDRNDGGTGELRLWDLPSARLVRTVSSPGFTGRVDLDLGGRFLVASAAGVRQGALALFDLDAPHGAGPTLLDGSDVIYLNTVRFSPDGNWLARVDAGTVTLWRTDGPRSTVLPRQPQDADYVTFTRDGDLLVLRRGAALSLMPLSPADSSGMRELWSRPNAHTDSPPGVDPTGRRVIVPDSSGRVNIVPLDGSEGSTHELKLDPGTRLGLGFLSPDGGFVAVSVNSSVHPEANAIRILDLETGSERSLDTHPQDSERCAEAGSPGDGVAWPFWLPDGRLVSEGDGGLRLWDLATGTSRRLRGCRNPSGWLPLLLATPDSRTILRGEPLSNTAVQVVTSFSAFDLATGEAREITSHGNRVGTFAAEASGAALVTGDQDGVVRVGRLDGDGEPHLLFGHTSPLAWVAVSPDGRRIASIDDDGNIRLWPMPDLSKPPLHTLPNDELLAKLRSLTNLRAVPDPGSDTGWKVEIGPFPGWATVPEWQP